MYFNYQILYRNIITKKKLEMHKIKDATFVTIKKQ